jgi:hypothetical protein
MAVYLKTPDENKLIELEADIAEDVLEFPQSKVI